MTRRLAITVRLALGITLSALAGVSPADPGGLSLTAVSGLTTDRGEQASKLTLGLGSLAASYQSYRQSVATGPQAPGTFSSRMIGLQLGVDTVVIDAVSTDDDPQALVGALKGLSAQVTAVAGRIVSAHIPLDKISALEGIAALRFAQPALSTTNTGLVTSQGDTAQRSALARTNFAVSGAGERVGLISDSFDYLGGYAADVTSGDLPSGVTVLDEGSSSDEGRAMAQIIHDVAPGATLAFHTANGGIANFAVGIQDLANDNCTVIVDDIIYLAEPMFQDGAIAQSVDAVNAQGIPYFSAAANLGRDGYASAFVSSGVAGPNGGVLHDFDPGPGVDTRLRINQETSTTYILQWQDRYFSVSGAPGAQSNLALCFYLTDGTLIGCTADANIGGDPIDGGGLDGFGNLDFSIELVGGPVPDQMKAVAFGGISFTDAYTGTNAGTIYGHANAAGANAVGAAAYFNTPAYGVAPPLLNDFSSAGNTPILFDTSGNPVNQTRQKPEFTAPDGGNNTFFGSDYEPDGYPNFFGTSAAAPHAAAVAALMREANPGLSTGQVTTILQDTAIDIIQRNTGEVFAVGPDNDSGAGLIDADAALAAAMQSDLTTVITLTPNVMIGPTPFEVWVQCIELLGTDTSGAITLRIPKDSRWSITSWDPNLESLPVSGKSVQNSLWTFSEDENTLLFSSNATISGAAQLNFGFSAAWDAGQTLGTYSASVTIVPYSGGEAMIDNNSDAEKADYGIE